MTNLHLHDSNDKHVGNICGYPEATEAQQRRFRHARGCLRHGKPFIRVGLSEGATDYLCPACLRGWAVPSPYFGDRRDNPYQLQFPHDWWGWSVAGVKAHLQESEDFVAAQGGGNGLVHWLSRAGTACGLPVMRFPMVPDVTIRWCKRCEKKRRK